MCQDCSRLLCSKNINSPKNLNGLGQPWQSLAWFQFPTEAMMGEEMFNKR